MSDNITNSIVEDIEAIEKETSEDHGIFFVVVYTPFGVRQIGHLCTHKLAEFPIPPKHCYVSAIEVSTSIH